MLQDIHVKRWFGVDKWNSQHIQQFYHQYDAMKEFLWGIISENLKKFDSLNAEIFVSVYQKFTKHPSSKKFALIINLIGWFLCINPTNSPLEGYGSF